MHRAIPRLAFSGVLSALLLALCIRLPHINDTTAALLMVLCILGISITWGWAEALTAAVVGGIGFDYYFLGPRGFSITAPEYGVALAAFLITAIATGQLATRLKRRGIEAVERKNEVEKLYRLGNAMLSGGGPEFCVEQLADQLVEIFGADGVALFDRQTGRIGRAGPRSSIISDQALRDIATSGPRLNATGGRCLNATGGRCLNATGGRWLNATGGRWLNATGGRWLNATGGRWLNATRGRWPEAAHSAFSLTPIQHGGELLGSIGMTGATSSAGLLGAIARNVGLGLTRLDAIKKTTEAEVMRRSEELKSAVLDAMAHEIRNPLSSARIAATTLLSRHPGNEMQKREMLTIIDEELKRMDRLIDEAAQISRVEASQVCLQKEPQDLAELISLAIDDMRALAGQRSIQVSVPEWLPPVECDKDLVARVLKQLLSNAMKYSPAGSPLTVSAEFIGKSVLLDVVDCGPGVHDEEQDRIFERYYRGRAARSGTPGTGLGLASARSIVQAHGGEIWVTSPPSGGAAFHVSLPATISSRAAMAS